jgi:hypothetical protein
MLVDCPHGWEDENGEPMPCPKCLIAEIERLRDTVAYLRPRMAVYQGQRMCSPATWQEFERRVDG